MKETLFEILERICENDIVKSNPDIDLFETDLMDSLGFAELLADMKSTVNNENLQNDLQQIIDNTKLAA